MQKALKTCQKMAEKGYFKNCMRTVALAFIKHNDDKNDHALAEAILNVQPTPIGSSSKSQKKSHEVSLKLFLIYKTLISNFLSFNLLFHVAQHLSYIWE